MATTRKDISEWFDEGKKQKATHMIVVCDTFDHEDFPVYVKKDEDVRKRVLEYSDSNKMSRVMEVYSLKMPKQAQLDEERAFHLDEPAPCATCKGTKKQRVFKGGSQKGAFDQECPNCKEYKPVEKYMLFRRGFRDGAAGHAKQHEGVIPYEAGYAIGRKANNEAITNYCQEIGYKPSVLR